MSENIPTPLCTPTEELKFHIKETFLNYCDYRKGTTRRVGSIEFELLEDYNEYLVYHLRPEPIIGGAHITGDLNASQ